MARLIGAPPGYVGYEEGGQLSDAVRKRPYSVVLFDEIEKAHPDVFNILLQVLDDGRLTDSQGRLVDFRNVLIIMTSNMGSAEMLEMGEKGADNDKIKETVMPIVRRNFKPEFLNRIDEIICFRKMTKQMLDVIVDLQLNRLIKLGSANAGIVIKPSAEAKRYLGDKGYDPANGARPLKRVIQKELQDRLATLTLDGTLNKGDIVRVHHDPVNGWVIKPEEPTPVVAPVAEQKPAVPAQEPEAPSQDATPSEPAAIPVASDEEAIGTTVAETDVNVTEPAQVGEAADTEERTVRVAKSNAVKK